MFEAMFPLSAGDASTLRLKAVELSILVKASSILLITRRYFCIIRVVKDDA